MAAMSSACLSSHFMINRDTASRDVDEGGRRLGHSRLQAPGLGHQVERLRDDAAPAGVGDVAERDRRRRRRSGSHRIIDPYPGRPPLCATIWSNSHDCGDAEAEAVAAGVQVRRPRRGARDRRRPRPPDLLHLAQRRAADRPGLGAIPRRIGGQQRADVLREVRDRRQHAAHHAEGAVGQRRLELPRLVFPAIAKRHAIGRARISAPGSSRSCPCGCRIFSLRYWRYGLPETLVTMRPRMAKP